MTPDKYTDLVLDIAAWGLAALVGWVVIWSYIWAATR